MKNAAIIIALILAYVLSSCGALSSDPDKELVRCPEDNYNYRDRENCDAIREQQRQQKGILVSGGFSGAFGLSVDGAEYPDIEAYYTAAVNDLPRRVAEAGYDEWKAALAAEIGFKDLPSDMTVYVQAQGARGYQGVTRMNGSGQFSLTLPFSASEDAYQIRANKRVAIVLTLGDKIMHWCYNFSAPARGVEFSELSKPVILRSFQTSITAYSCFNESKQETLPIPAKSE